MILTNCPACQDQIDTERIIHNKAYCACGQVIELSGDYGLSNDLILLRRLGILVVIGILVAAHCIAWGSYSIQILPLKAKQMLGFASIDNLQSIANICDTQKHWSCEIQALAALYQKSATVGTTGEAASSLAYLAQLAQVQQSHNEQEQASVNYALYFHLGGHDQAVRLEYANLLASLGDVHDARNEFSYLVDRRSAKPQFEVAREYVHFLMKNHDYPAAKKIIRRYRRYSPTAAMFLNSEWIQINDQLRGSRAPASYN